MLNKTVIERVVLPIWHIVCMIVVINWEEIGDILQEEWSGICSKGGRNVAVDDQEWRRNYNGIISNGEREARVSRYREKRRTRLFSKKIRYQVRKLNAEKRPRMKGRFVKRTTTT